VRVLVQAVAGLMQITPTAVVLEELTQLETVGMVVHLEEVDLVQLDLMQQETEQAEAEAVAPLFKTQTQLAELVELAPQA
jgi:hypothetical protein